MAKLILGIVVVWTACGLLTMFLDWLFCKDKRQYMQTSFYKSGYLFAICLIASLCAGPIGTIDRILERITGKSFM